MRKFWPVVIISLLAVALPLEDSAAVWQWINPLPQGNTLQGAAAVGDNIYAVGGIGSVVRYDGANWSLLPFPWREQLRGVWGSSPSNLYAVGRAPGVSTSGGIYRYNGADWSLELTLPFYEFRSVWGAAPDSVFAGAGGGRIFFYDGSSWSDLSPGMGINWNVTGIWGSSADDVFAVAGPFIVHWDGAAWTTMTRTGRLGLADIWGSAPDDVYAVGQGGRIYRYDGDDWSLSLNAGGFTLNAVWGRSGNEVYAFGDSYPAQGFRYDGAGWSSFSVPTDQNIYAAAGTTALGVIAAGENGQILNYDGNNWIRVNRFWGHTVRGIWGSGPNDVYVVWDGLSHHPDDRSTALHYNGAAWNILTFPDPPNSVWGSSADNALVGSEYGKIFRYDGAAWSLMTDLQTGRITGIHGGGEDDVFAVSIHGGIYHYDGTNWSLMSETGRLLFDVWGDSAGGAFSAAADGPILRYDGDEWTVSWSPDAGGNYWTGVWGSSPDNVYAVTAERIIRFDGDSWSEIETGLQIKSFYGIWGSGPDDIFVAGGAAGPMNKVWGRVYHYDGAGWTDIGIPCESGLQKVWGSSGEDVYFGGYLSGSVIRYGGGRFPDPDPEPEEISWHLPAGAGQIGEENLSTYILISNPANNDARVAVRFFDANGPAGWFEQTVSAGSRATVRMGDHVQGPGTISTIVTSLNGVPIFCERATYGPVGEWVFGSAASGVESLSEVWHLAEGATHFFDQFIHILNPGDEGSAVTVVFTAGDGAAGQVETVVEPLSNWTVQVNAVAGFDGRGQVSTRVESDRPVAVERTIFWPKGGPWSGGHASIGAAAPALTWRLAEGATHIFDCYLLIFNPSETESAEILIGFTGTAQGIIFHPAEVGPLSRYTLKVNDVVGAAGAVAATVVSDIPVVAERAMYWPAGETWTGGHGSMGAPQASAAWHLAEGATHTFDCYLLIFNPSDTDAATVDFNFLDKHGDAVTHQETVSPLGRTTVKVNQAVGSLDAFSTVVNSDLPVVVERAMFWPRGGPWTGGHGSMGIPEL